MKIDIERAMEILNPEHRERYDDLEEVNEACRMGANALLIVREIMQSGGLPDKLTEAADMMRRGLYEPGQRATMRRAAALLEKACGLFAEEATACGGDSCPIRWLED